MIRLCNGESSSEGETKRKDAEIVNSPFRKPNQRIYEEVLDPIINKRFVFKQEGVNVKCSLDGAEKSSSILFTKR